MAGAFGGEDDIFEDYLNEDENYPDPQVSPSDEGDDDSSNDGGQEDGAESIKEQAQEAVERAQKEAVKQAKKKAKKKAKKEISKKILMKIIAVIGPVIPYILLTIVIIAGIGGVAYAAYSITQNILDGILDDNSSALMGVNGEHFYACRLTYKDDEKAKIELAKSYYETAKNVFAELKSINKVDSYNINITVDFDDLGDYVWQTSSTANNNINGYLLGMAKAVYLDDYGTNSTFDYQGTLSAIKYFGLNSSMNNVKKYLADYVKEHYSFVFTNSANEEFRNTVTEKLNGEIESVVNRIITNDVRTEKVFVNTQIFESEDDGMKVTKENYISVEYMPKHGIIINNFEFNVATDNTEDFNVKFFLNNEQISLEKTSDNGSTYMEYQSDIDGLIVNKSEYVNTLTAGDKSFYEIVKNAGNKNEISNYSNNIYSTIVSGLYAEFNSTSNFIFINFADVE